VILPSGDPLRRGDEPVALVALADREWVLFEREHALGQLVERLCAAEASRRGRPCGALRSPALPRWPQPDLAPPWSRRTSSPPPCATPFAALPGPAPASCARSPAPAGRPWRGPLLDLIAEQPWRQREPGMVPVA
jgi:hypothetical protein